MDCLIFNIQVENIGFDTIFNFYLLYASLAIEFFLFNIFVYVYFRWMQTGSLQASSHISSLSWNLEGTRLLTGGVKIQMWHEKITAKEEEPNGKFGN